MNYWKKKEDNIIHLGSEFEEGGWYVEITDSRFDGFKLYEIPLYGGKPNYMGTYTDIHIAIEAGEELT